MNCTLIFHDNLAAGATKLNLDNGSVGPAAQTGFDYVLNDRWSVNVDIKRMMLRSDVSLVGGAKFTQVQLDPWLYSLGLAYRF